MIKKFIERVFGANKPRKQALVKERIYVQAEHGIRRDELSNAAISVCEGLHRAGFKAFVVGGAVRDLLLRRHPKDYDVATDATPEQVRNVFRRARIIGRRFKLVHVMFRDETVEVSTFRANHPAADADEQDGRADEHGRLLRDNVYGNQQEDAIRRDFTMNAAYYDIISMGLMDPVRGASDIEQNLWKTVDAVERTGRLALPEPPVGRRSRLFRPSDVRHHHGIERPVVPGILIETQIEQLPGGDLPAAQQAGLIGGRSKDER